MGPKRSFYLTGPSDQQRRAQYPIAFMDIGDDVNDATMRYHALRRDFSYWVRDSIGDRELADRIEDIEALRRTPARGLRKLMRQTIERRYTMPA